MCCPEVHIAHQVLWFLEQLQHLAVQMPEQISILQLVPLCYTQEYASASILIFFNSVHSNFFHMYIPQSFYLRLISSKRSVYISIFCLSVIISDPITFFKKQKRWQNLLFKERALYISWNTRNMWVEQVLSSSQVENLFHKVLTSLR
jgi:hypothetical protein